jgi:glycosyltransferase involved in cell wall biosynthesis
LDIQWIICGSGIHEKRFREFVNEEELNKRVHVIGHVDVMEVLYQWCDVLVHLTRIDAFPNTTLEAMMCCKPVITNNDSCGTREQVFNGMNGFVVDGGRSFLRALRSYQGNPALRKLHGEKGKSIVVTEFSIEAQARRMQEALKEFSLVVSNNNRQGKI